MYCQITLQHVIANLLKMLLIHSLLLLSLFMGVLYWSMFCYAVFTVLSSFSIILLRESWSLGYKTFIVLNPTEHDISNPHKN